MRWRPVFTLVLALTSGGCQGSEDPPPTSVNAPSADPLRPLTPAQYAASLTTIFGPEVASEASVELAAIPPIAAKGRLDAEVLDVSRASEDAVARAAERVAHAAASTDQRRAALLPCLANSPPAQSCVAQFVAKYGRLTHRRPLTEVETAEYLTLFRTVQATSPEQAIELSLYAMLLSPRFRYRVEDGGSLLQGTTDVARLTPYEQVSRLSFLLLGSTPSEQLLDLAAGEPPEGSSNVGAWADALVNRPGFTWPGLSRFFEQWLGFRNTPELPYPPGYVDPFVLAGLHDDMLAEVRDVLNRHVFQQDSTLADLLTTPDAWLRSPGLATIYGRTMADGGEGGRRPITDGTRAGLLTLPGMLRGLGEFPSPVPRGLRVLDAFLCRPIPIPDPATLPEAALALPESNGELTNRQRWEAKASGPSCAQCHTDLHAVGFALEHYDTLGRYRTEENTLGVLWPGQGQMAGIDARTVLMLDGAPVAIDGAMSLSRALAASPEVHRCVASWWYREVAGHAPSDADAPLIDELAARIATEPFTAALRSITGSAAFQLRRIPE